MTGEIHHLQIIVGGEELLVTMSPSMLLHCMSFLFQHSYLALCMCMYLFMFIYLPNFLYLHALVMFFWEISFMNVFNMVNVLTFLIDCLETM